MHYNVMDTAENPVPLIAKVYQYKGIAIGLIRPSQLLEIQLIPKCFKRMKLGRETCRSKAKVALAVEVMSGCTSSTCTSKFLGMGPGVVRCRDVDRV